MASLTINVGSQSLALNTPYGISYDDSVDSLLSTDGVDKGIFSNFNTSGAAPFNLVNASYNGGLWGSGGGGGRLDFSGVNWTGNFGAAGFCAAITRRHAIICTHARADIGDTFQYVTPTNQLVERTAIDMELFVGGSAEDGNSTLTVLYLDADLPTSVAIYPLMADNVTNMVGKPCIRVDQERKAIIANVLSFGSPYLACTSIGLNAARAAYYEDLIGGDSGGPWFFLVGKQLIYATSSVNGFGGSGPNVSAMVSDVLDACEALDERNDQTGYAPTLFEGS